MQSCDISEEYWNLRKRERGSVEYPRGAIECTKHSNRSASAPCRGDCMKTQSRFSNFDSSAFKTRTGQLVAYRRFIAALFTKLSVLTISGFAPSS